MNTIERLMAIDVRTIVKSPFIDIVRDNHQVRAYLMAPGTYYEYALVSGETDLETLKLLNMADAVSYQIRHCIASRRPYWGLLNRELWHFLAYNQAAARTLIPKVLNKLQQEILKKEYYELMPPYALVRDQVEQTISIKRYPYKKA